MLSPQDLASCSSALGKVSDAADLAEQKAQDADTWWARTVLGADSTIAGLKADAAATRNGYDTMRARLDAWTADPSQADHAAALDFITACGHFADVSPDLAAAKMLTASNTITTVAADTAHDVVKDVAAGATAGLGIYLTLALLGVGGFALFSFLKRGRK